MARNMGNRQWTRWRTKRARDDYTGDMVDGHHVDRVLDIGRLAELRAALDHADEKVVGVGYCLVCVSESDAGEWDSDSYLQSWSRRRRSRDG